MKKPGVFLLALVFLLTGCSGKKDEIERGMELRARLLRAETCSFDAVVTADYGTAVYEFGMACETDERGDFLFEVTAPETISGITGGITREGGKLTFTDAALQFDLMADDQVTPVAAPWILLKTLREGFLTAAGMEGELLRLTIDDSYEDDALQLDAWLDEENQPIRGEILYDGRRILTIAITNFVLR